MAIRGMQAILNKNITVTRIIEMNLVFTMMTRLLLRLAKQIMVHEPFI